MRAPLGRALIVALVAAGALAAWFLTYIFNYGWTR